MPTLRVLVTGASSGIGAAVSTLLSYRGYRVVGNGRRTEAMAVTPEGPFEAAVVRDLTEPGAPEEVVEKAVATLGGLDVVVSSAGAGWLGPFWSMSPSEIDAILDINLRVPVHLAHAAAPHLLASGGQLVLVGSIAGLVGVPEEVAYSTAKAGLRGLADSLRVEWWREAAKAQALYKANDPPGAQRPAAQDQEAYPNDGGSELAGRSGLAARFGRAGGLQPRRRPTVTLVSPGAVATPFFSRRNLPYTHSWPRPMPVERVATRIVRAIEHRQEYVVVPAWLDFAARLNGGFPGLYRLLEAWPLRRRRLASS
jgi:NAD(P)-dependent dehydrogenase (short-subunit alcohol dehydrogenase family)